MHLLLQVPWTEDANALVQKWMDDALKDEIINDDTGIGTQEIVDIVEHAERCDTLCGMSVVEAGILFSLWVGRSYGAAQG